MTGSIVFSIVIGIVSTIGAVASYKKGNSIPKKWVNTPIYKTNPVTQITRKIGTVRTRDDDRDLWFGLAITLGAVTLGCIGYICSTF